MTAADLRDNPFDALSDGDRRRLLDEVAEEALSMFPRQDADGRMMACGTVRYAELYLFDVGGDVLYAVAHDRMPGETLARCLARRAADHFQADLDLAADDFIERAVAF